MSVSVVTGEWFGERSLPMTVGHRMASGGLPVGGRNHGHVKENLAAAMIHSGRMQQDKYN